MFGPNCKQIGSMQSMKQETRSGKTKYLENGWRD